MSDEETTLTLETKVWVVYGPDAQHGDGQGVKFVTDSEESADGYILGEKAYDLDVYWEQGDDPGMEMAEVEARAKVKEEAHGNVAAWEWDTLSPFMGWPMNTVGYGREERTLSYLGVTQDQLEACFLCGYREIHIVHDEERTDVSRSHKYTRPTLEDILQELNDF